MAQLRPVHDLGDAVKDALSRHGDDLAAVRSRAGPARRGDQRGCWVTTSRRMMPDTAVRD